MVHNHLAALAAVLVTLSSIVNLASCQLPEDMQRDLEQNLAEQARLQAMRQQQQQQQAQSRMGSSTKPGNQLQPQQQQPKHDPNNYSYQQVSPPIQYSYYQPYGDAASPAQPTQQQTAQPAPKIDFDLNNLNFDLPQPQARVASASSPATSGQTPALVPSFTGAGGLPVMQPAAQSASSDSAYAPPGQAPLAPQARVQQGPPLTEADFKDITGGENYGAPSGNDFGVGGAGGGNSRADNTDAQLREFGLPGGDSGSGDIRRQSQNMNIPDFGGFNPVGIASGSSQRQPARRNDGSFGDFGNFGADFGGASPSSTGFGNQDASPRSGSKTPPGGDFDFASQPSSNQGDQASQVVSGGAPGSLQSLLGSSFPGLGGQTGGLDGFTRGGHDPQQAQKARNDDGALDIADLGEKSDQFSGADLGGFEQPGPQNDQDFNYGSASNQQPKSVPYADANPQPVGTLWALTQPQSLTQTRYNALPDKGTYQDYPAYQSGGNDFGAVAEVVDSTPRARRPAPGRYSTPAASELAPEHSTNGRYDYGQAPAARAYVSRYGF